MFAYTMAGPDTPGFAVVTDRFVVLMSADASTETVRAVHRLVDSHAVTAHAAIELLSGSAGAQRFAVVEILDPWTQEFQVSVRGDITVDLGGATTTRFTWPQGNQLLIGEASGVESLHLALSTPPADAPRLPLRHGAVAANAIYLDQEQRLESEDPDRDHADTIARRRPSEESAPQPALADKPETPVELALPDEPTPASAVSQAAMEDPPTAAHAGDGANAVAPGGVDPRPLPVDLASLMASEPSPLWTLTLPDGNELFAAPLIVVGRRPWRSDPAETQTYYVKAPSPHREISSKHVEFTVSGGQLRARDLNSTNGTVVESQGRAPRLLRDGQDTALAVGDVLDLGEGFRIVVGSKRGVDHMAVLAPPNVVHNMAWPKTD